MIIIKFLVTSPRNVPFLKNCRNCLVMIMPFNLLLFVAAERVIRISDRQTIQKMLLELAKVMDQVLQLKKEAEERKVKTKK